MTCWKTLPVYVVLLSEDYHVAFANKFFRERFGESHGRRCYEYLFHRAEPCENCETFKVFKTRAPHHWEWTGPDGRNYDIHDFPFTDTDGATLVLEMGIDITERKKAEAALQSLNEALEQRVTERTTALAESEARLATVFRTSPTGIFIVRSADGLFLDVNAAYLRIIGYPAEEVLGHTSVELNLWVKPEDRDRIVSMIREQGRVDRFEVQFRRKSGEIVDLLASALSLPWGGESCILGTLTDISARKQAEAALRKSDATLRGILDATQESIWLFSPERSHTSWGIRWRWRALSGRPAKLSASISARSCLRNWPSRVWHA